MMQRRKLVSGERITKLSKCFHKYWSLNDCKRSVEFFSHRKVMKIRYEENR